MRKEKLIESLTGYEFKKIIKKKFPNYINLFNNEENVKIEDSLSKFADKRTPNDYIKELIYSWIIEDYLVYKFSTENIKIYRNGCDKENKVLKAKDVTTREDLICEINGKKVYIEVVTDFSSFWKRYKKVHFRNSKLPNLIKKSKYKDVYVLFLDIVNKEIGLLKIDKNLSVNKIDSHEAYGGKTVYEIDVPIFEKIENAFPFYSHQA